MIRTLKAWGPAAFWAAALFLLSELSTVPRGGEFPYDDKIVHFLLYGVLGAALGWGRRTAGTAVPHGALLVAGWAYGALDEWHQSFVPGRTPDGADFVADVVGVAVGYALLLFAARWIRSGTSAAPSSTDTATPNSDRRRRGR